MAMLDNQMVYDLMMLLKNKIGGFTLRDPSFSFPGYQFVLE